LDCAVFASASWPAEGKFPESKKLVGKNMINYPIADLLVRIKNATLARQKSVSVPYSRLKENLAKVLAKEGVVEKVEVSGEGAGKELHLTLSEEKGQVRPIEVRIISKPGRRVYCHAKDIRRLRRGLGITVISTPAGLMTDKEALKKNVGGEVICRVI
jgi:small subunit ribosomal protein S8